MFVQERGGNLTYLWIPTDSMSNEEFTRFLNEKNEIIIPDIKVNQVQNNRIIRIVKADRF